MTKSTKLLIGLLLISVLFSGCRAKETIVEKTVTRTDSTALTRLQDSLFHKQIQIGILTSELKRVRAENTSLRSEKSEHRIEYDNKAPVNPETGKYPILNETITKTNSLLEKSVKEYEILTKEYRSEIAKLTMITKNQETIINSLREENKDLQTKIEPQSGTNFRMIVLLFVAGFVAGFVVRLFLKL